MDWTRRAIVAGLALGAVLAAAAAAAQPGRAARPPADLSGLWTNVSATPLERPKSLTGPTASDAEAAAYLKAYAADNAADDASGVGGGESEWWERGTQLLRIGGRFRTSVVVEPADGRLPWSPAGRAAIAAGFKPDLDNPERRPVTERCLTGPSSNASPPMLPHRSTSVYKFVQSPGFLAIWIEGGRGPRIIPLAGGGRGPAGLHPWSGEAQGHWEGRTLVVETTDFHPQESVRWPMDLYIAPDARVTERFTRLSRDEILYAFSVDDPKSYTRPWRGELIFRSAKGPIFEYACHEGNYSLPGILAGARREEAAARR